MKFTLTIECESLEQLLNSLNSGDTLTQAVQIAPPRIEVKKTRGPRKPDGKGTSEICPECQKTFIRKKIRQKFCSNSCKSQSNIRKARAKNPSIKKTVHAVCELCSTSFNKRTPKQRFCSQLCANKATSIIKASKSFKPNKQSAVPAEPVEVKKESRNVFIVGHELQY